MRSRTGDYEDDEGSHPGLPLPSTPAEMVPHPPVPSRPWPDLAAGTTVTVLKLGPDGSEVARYPGVVIEVDAPEPWVAVEARWVRRVVELDGLRFVPGDTLHEFFSPVDWFNVFVVFAPHGQLRGWYGNVTYPTTLDPETNPPTLTWHDLYLDVVALPDGTVVVRDEEELAEAELARRDPGLHAAVLAARDEMLRRWAVRAFPFHGEGGGSEP